MARFTAGSAEKTIDFASELHRMPASSAKSMMALTYAVFECDAVIENETFAAPQAIGRRDARDIVQDAAAQLVDVREALLKKIGTGLLAPNASRAEHRDLSLPVTRKLAPDKIGKLTECTSLRIVRALECADLELIIVARIDEQHTWLADKSIPIFGFDAHGSSLRRPYFGASERDDLASYLHLEPLKGMCRCLGKLYLQI